MPRLAPQPPTATALPPLRIGPCPQRAVGLLSQKLAVGQREHSCPEPWKQGSYTRHYAKSTSNNSRGRTTPRWRAIQSRCDPLHAIYGMPSRTPLLRAFAAGQVQSTTVRWAPLLSLAVPCFMPQTCPKGASPRRRPGLPPGWVHWWVWASSTQRPSTAMRGADMTRSRRSTRSRRARPTTVRNPRIRLGRWN
jgi:hypothetical protein